MSSMSQADSEVDVNGVKTVSAKWVLAPGGSPVGRCCGRLLTDTEGRYRGEGCTLESIAGVREWYRWRYPRRGRSL